MASSRHDTSPEIPKRAFQKRILEDRSGSDIIFQACWFGDIVSTQGYITTTHSKSNDKGEKRTQNALVRTAVKNIVQTKINPE